MFAFFPFLKVVCFGLVMVLHHDFLLSGAAARGYMKRIFGDGKNCSRTHPRKF
jgi:hypothetical protein